MMGSNPRPFSMFRHCSFSGPEKVNSLSCQQIIIKCSALSLNRCRACMVFLLLTGFADLIKRGLSFILVYLWENRMLIDLYLVVINWCNPVMFATLFITWLAVTVSYVLICLKYRKYLIFNFLLLWGWNISCHYLRGRTGISARVQWLLIPVPIRWGLQCLIWKTISLCNTEVSKMVSCIFSFLLYKENIWFHPSIPLISYLSLNTAKQFQKITAKILFLFGNLLKLSQTYFSVQHPGQCPHWSPPFYIPVIALKFLAVLNNTFIVSITVLDWHFWRRPVHGTCLLLKFKTILWVPKDILPVLGCHKTISA